MNWILTCTGGRYHFGANSGGFNHVPINEIAHALSLINRFTGHTSRPYSVAEHSLLCAQVARDMGLPARAQLAALLHDAHEAYTGDLSSPAKWEIGQAWDQFEDVEKLTVRNTLRVRDHFSEFRDEIRHIDLLALATERRDLTSFMPGLSHIWPILDTHGKEVLPLAISLNDPKREALTWRDWEDGFLREYWRLTNEPNLPSDTRTDTEMLDFMERHRVLVTPEYEGPWEARIYGDNEKPSTTGVGKTPRSAIADAIAQQVGKAGA